MHPWYKRLLLFNGALYPAFPDVALISCDFIVFKRQFIRGLIQEACPLHREPHAAVQPTSVLLPAPGGTASLIGMCAACPALTAASSRPVVTPGDGRL